MGISPYLAQVREQVGHRLLCLPSVTGLIRNPDGDVLLVRNMGMEEWNTPGGMIEPCDRPAESVVREMKEEIGVDVEPVALLGVFSGPEYVIRYPNGDEVVYVTSVFDCKILRGELQPDQDEIDACRFFSKKERDEVLTPTWLDDLLEHVESGRRFN